MTVKTSILVFYLTLTRNQKVFRWANYVTLFVVNAAGFALTMINVFQCRPVSAAFFSTVPPGATCTDIVTLYLSSSPVNIITDLAILFLPMPILTQMRLPFKQKAILVITFSFGFFVAVVDVIRIAFLQQAAISRQANLSSIHIQNSGGSDFSCKCLLISFGHGFTSLIIPTRVCVPFVHVVSGRSQRFDNVRLRSEPQAPSCSPFAEIDQGHQ